MFCVNCREGETFGGLSGMLRQILSPSPETNDGSSYSSCCSMLQPGIFTNYPMMSPSIQHVIPTSSSSLLPYHHTSHSTSLISLEQSTANLPIDHLEIHVQTQQCNNCGLEFHSISKFNYHIRICQQQQNINDELRRRNDGGIDIIQNQNIKYSCTLCGRLFQTLNHLRMHEVSHSSQLQQQPIQQLQHQQQQQQQIDILTNNEQTFRCDKCQASFRYRTLLERHKKIHIIGQDKPYVCPRCPMRFETRTLYNHHAKTHKPIVNEQIIDNNQITNINNLNSTSGINQSIDNKLLIETSGSYKCDSCTKQFLTIESLTSHKAIHRLRPLICDVCGKGFTHRKYYVVHQRIHTGERPYLCAMCGKSFTQASTLTVHRRYHTGERPYICTLCGKGFVTRTIMLNHMKKH